MLSCYNCNAIQEYWIYLSCYLDKYKQIVVYSVISRIISFALLCILSIPFVTRTLQLAVTGHSISHMNFTCHGLWIFLAIYSMIYFRLSMSCNFTNIQIVYSVMFNNILCWMFYNYFIYWHFNQSIYVYPYYRPFTVLLSYFILSLYSIIYSN